MATPGSHFIHYVERIEAAVSDESALHALVEEVKGDKNLADRDRESLLGRAQRYLMDFEKVAESRESAEATNEIMGRGT